MLSARLRRVYGKKAKLKKIQNCILASIPWRKKAEKQRMAEEEELKTQLRADINWLQAEIFKARFKKQLAATAEEEELKTELRADINWLQAEIVKARFKKQLAATRRMAEEEELVTELRAKINWLQAEIDLQGKVQE